MTPGKPLNETSPEKLLLEQLHRTQKITLKDSKAGVNIERMMLSLMEEVGELAAAIKIKFGYKDAKLVEEPVVEAVDVIICGLAMYVLCGGSIDYLGTNLCQKLNKWENFQKKKERLKKDVIS